LHFCTKTIKYKDMVNQEILQESSEMVLSRMLKTEHEQVVFCHDKHTGLKAIIGIHNTVLGPALGGTRMWNYATEQDALTDVLRLSRGMTYKSAISGLNLGGGKAVIIGDSKTQKNEALMRRFGKFVDSLAGKYITAEDVGMSPKDMEYIAMETDYVVGKPKYMGGTGDPSPVTAYGVYMGMKAAAKEAFGIDSLAGKSIMVQGAGHVGANLVDLLMKENAVVYISDIDEDKIKAITQKHPAVKVVPAENVYDTPTDIYAPCALGATINDNTLSKLKCAVIAGAANNQLEDEKIHGEKVMEMGIIYAPDYLINAGGVINCYTEVQGLEQDYAIALTENIYNTTLEVIKRSKTENIPTYLIANQMAEERIARIAKLNSSL
jgi:leucine dehydrogenase